MWIKERDYGATYRGRQCWPSHQIEVGGNVVGPRDIGTGAEDETTCNARQKDGRDISRIMSSAKPGQSDLLSPATENFHFLHTFYVVDYIHLP